MILKHGAVDNIWGIEKTDNELCNRKKQMKYEQKMKHYK